MGVLLLGMAMFAILSIVGHTQRGKDGLRHALNLEGLPSSVRIKGFGGESWTDYLFEADIRIDPEEIPELLKGREFSGPQLSREEIDTNWITGFKSMVATERWY